MSIKKLLDTCGCCEPPALATPLVIYNRPSLSAIIYRVGDYASFRQAMIQAIPRLGAKLAAELGLADWPLERWTARQSDDYGIALLEMWATVGDILTFYQERIANEAYLRTALQRDSVRRLAAMLDYKLNPGIAASTWLAFALDKGATVSIPTRLRAQSVPKQGQTPQKFETIETIEARATLNKIRIYPSPQLYNPLAQNSSQASLISNPKEPTPGDKIAMFDATRVEFKQVSELQTEEGQTFLSWTPPVQASLFRLFTTRLMAYSRQFRLFGYNAPTSYMEPTSGAGGVINWVIKSAPTNYQFSLPTPPTNVFLLDGRYEDLKPGNQLLLVQTGASPAAPQGFARLAKILNVTSQPAKFGPLDDTVTQVTLDLVVASTPVVVRDVAGRIQVFVIGDDAAVWNIGQAAPNDGWGSWTSLGGQVDLLAVERNQDGRLEVFGRGMDKALWHIWQLTPGGNWSDWATLGGQIDLLAVGNNQDGRLEVFARGMNKALWHIWQVAPNNGWSGWATLGGQIDMLAVGRNQDGRLEVFARGMNLALWHIWQVAPNDGWSGWASLDGQIDLLAVGRNQDGRLEVFARGMNKALWHIWQVAPNDGWSGWASLGGQIDLLAVGRNQDGRLEVFARGMDKALWHIWQVAPNNGWSSWASRSGQIDLLAVGNNQDGRLEVFGRGMNKGLWHIWQNVPNDGWSGWASRGVPMWPVSDRRQVTVLELVKSPILFWNRRYTDTISGNTIYILAEAIDKVEARRRLILDDDQANPQVVTVTATSQVDLDGDGQPDYWAVDLTPTLARHLNSKTAVLYGNVARATHGETVKNEIIGSGDASQVFQSFMLKKDSVTHIASASAPGGALNTLSLLVNQVAWTETPSLYGRGAKDRVYTTEINDDATMTVRFGDGVRGARLPTGQKNIIATYRQGLGLAGNLDGGALSVALDRPVGLKSLTNPLPASGGADPEKMDQARTNAPNTVRTFERAISLRDFEDLARSFASVAKSRVTWVWDGEAQTIYLTVAGQNGTNLSDEEIKTLRAFLDQRRDPNRPLLIGNYVPVAIVVTATLEVDPAHVNNVVQSAAQAALNEYFSFTQREFGQAVHLSDVYAVLQSVEGVVSVDVDGLRYKYPVVAAAHGATAAPVQAHIRINQARPNAAPPPKVRPAELAMIEFPTDISLTAFGGLPS